MIDRSKLSTSLPMSRDTGPRRRPWTSPRLQDHGSLRTFVRQISGTFDDGQAPPQGQGGMMQSMSSGGGD